MRPSGAFSLPAYKIRKTRLDSLASSSSAPAVPARNCDKSEILEECGIMGGKAFA